MTSGSIFCSFDTPLPLGFSSALWSKVRKVVGEEFTVVDVAAGGGVFGRLVALGFVLKASREVPAWLASLSRDFTSDTWSVKVMLDECHVKDIWNHRCLSRRSCNTIKTLITIKEQMRCLCYKFEPFHGTPKSHGWCIPHVLYIDPVVDSASIWSNSPELLEFVFFFLVFASFLGSSKALKSIFAVSRSSSSNLAAAKWDQ